MCSAVMAGCHQLDCDLGSTASVRAAPAIVAVRDAAPLRRKQTVLKRVAEPQVVSAGSKIRNFCGQRHIRFQSGALKESSPEKARNDTLCRQVY